MWEEGLVRGGGGCEALRGTGVRTLGEEGALGCDPDPFHSSATELAWRRAHAGAIQPAARSQTVPR